MEDEFEIRFDSEEFHNWLSSEMAKKNIRLDAQQTATLAKQLEHVFAKTYDVKYPELRARDFIPVDNSVSPAAEYYVHRQWDMIGMAVIIASYADDLPAVDAIVKEFPGPIKSMGASYKYSFQDLRRAAQTGSQLETRKARAARRAHEQLHDSIGALGNAAAGLGGFLNNGNVPIISPDNDPWSAATPLDVIADLNKLANSIPVATNHTFAPNTLLCDTASFQLISTTPISADNSMTILKFFLETHPHITDIDQWYKLDTAGVGATNRVVAYDRSDEVLSLVIPQEFEQFAAVVKNLVYIVNTHSRTGGVTIRHPLAIAYMDGV